MHGDAFDEERSNSSAEIPSSGAAGMTSTGSNNDTSSLATLYCCDTACLCSGSPVFYITSS